MIRYSKQATRQVEVFAIAVSSMGGEKLDEMVILWQCKNKWSILLCMNNAVHSIDGQRIVRLMTQETKSENARRSS